MTQLVAVVMQEHLEELTRILLKEGVLHFISIREVHSGGGTESLSPKISRVRLAEVRKRVEYLMDLGDLQPPRGKDIDPEQFDLTDPDKLDKEINPMTEKVELIRNKQKDLQQEILKLQEIHRQIELIDNLQDYVTQSSSSSYLKVRAGTLEEEKRSSLNHLLFGMPSVLMSPRPEEDLNLLITLRKDEEKVTEALKAVSWKEMPISLLESEDHSDLQKGIEEQIFSLREQQNELKEQVEGYLKDKESQLMEYWKNIRGSQLFYQIQERFSKTSRTYLFSGWLPEEKKEELEKGILSICGNQCYLEWRKGENNSQGKALEPPVTLEVHPLLKPFRNLVVNYNTPAYGTINPTLLVAIAYCLMFGLMFGDAGQGLVILLIGIIGTLRNRKAEKESTLMPLFIYCGISATLFGLLFGSWFGFPWTKALWFDYHGVVNGHSSGSVGSIYDVLGITIYFGAAIILCGMLLNWINRFLEKDWINLIFDKTGLLGGWIFVAGFYTARYLVQNDYRNLPPGNLLFLILGLPSILLFVKPLVENFHHPKGHRHGPMDLIMEWIVELLEVFSGYLANTLSFMRVAGLGIAHVSLMTAFYQISLMFGGGTDMTLAGVAILVLGNLMVIALEGLSAGIQSLRLNYYEFFTKFFVRSGRLYKPIRLE